MGWDNDQWGPMHEWNGGHGYYGLGMGIFFIVLVALAVWAIVRTTRHSKVSNSTAVASSASNRETPRDILDRRFANGEISADEYQKAKELLGS